MVYFLSLIQKADKMIFLGRHFVESQRNTRVIDKRHFFPGSALNLEKEL